MNLSETTFEMGKLLRASIIGCVVGCSAAQAKAPVFGGLVRIPLEDGYEIYGLVYDIHIDDDGLVRQLVTASSGVSPEVILDSRINRSVPLEISVLHVGYRLGKAVYHLLPPRPPLSLDTLYGCGAEELRQFTSAGRFGYFRHILRAADLPVGELLAAHLQQAHAVHAASNPKWSSAAAQELITLLRDDYPTLMSVLGAIGELDIVG